MRGLGPGGRRGGDEPRGALCAGPLGLERIGAILNGGGTCLAGGPRGRNDDARAFLGRGRREYVPHANGVGQGFVKTPDFIELIYNELAGTPTRTSQLDRTHH
jgi:hypothetical protein